MCLENKTIKAYFLISAENKRSGEILGAAHRNKAGKGVKVNQSFEKTKKPLESYIEYIFSYIKRHLNK